MSQRGTYQRHDPPSAYQCVQVTGEYRYQIPVGPQHDTEELAKAFVASLPQDRSYRIQKVVKAVPPRK
jgi:hypothetical protein